MKNNLFTLPYEIARLPIAIVDRGLLGKLPEASAPRVVADRAIGSADKLAGALLGNHQIAERGADRIERSDKLRAAARLEKQADERREQARETSTAGLREAAQKRDDAIERAASGLEEAEVAEARGKQQAAAKARKSASAKKSTANKRAASKSTAAEQRKDRVESAAEAKKKAKKSQAKKELDDARETKQSAAEARADADRLDDLTEARKQQRQQG